MNTNSLIAIWGVFCLAVAWPAVICAQAVTLEPKINAIEDFETGDFSKFNWQHSGNLPWTITDINPYEGVYSARSGAITHSQFSALTLEYEVYVQDTLSFWLRVSSEQNYDFLRFYQNGVQKGQWSGTVAWQKASFVIPVGVHTFKWEYSKDASVSVGQDACWIDYITFPPADLEALFYTDSTVVCQGDSVYFYDQSIGPVIEWYWVFTGATPQTSTLQNPVVTYANPGTFNVFLEVSDGIETATIFLENYMQVITVPQTASTPTGMTFLCATWGNSSYNTVPQGGGVTSYHWTITPDTAGTISGNGSTNITVIWNPDFLGVAQLRVAGVNYCGIGVYSNPLNITRYLPDVTLTVPDYVSITTPPFQLTGGSPAGGIYSGPGVSNGIFYPEEAGLGDHTITYTYTDPNLCENFATAVITVTETTGIVNASAIERIRIFPNPNSGQFTLKIHPMVNEWIDVRIFNALSKMVYSENEIEMSGGAEILFNLDHMPKGLYYIVISGKEFKTVRKIVIQ
jgi:PKD repeat protein